MLEQDMKAGMRVIYQGTAQYGRRALNGLTATVLPRDHYDTGHRIQFDDIAEATRRLRDSGVTTLDTGNNPTHYRAMPINLQPLPDTTHEVW